MAARYFGQLPRTSIPAVNQFSRKLADGYFRYFILPLIEEFGESEVDPILDILVRTELPNLIHLSPLPDNVVDRFLYLFEPFNFQVLPSIFIFDDNEYFRQQALLGEIVEYLHDEPRILNRIIREEGVQRLNSVSKNYSLRSNKPESRSQPEAAITAHEEKLEFVLRAHEPKNLSAVYQRVNSGRLDRYYLYYVLLELEVLLIKQNGVFGLRWGEDKNFIPMDSWAES